MAIGDIYGITLVSGFAGNIAEQVFFYELTSGSSSASAPDLAAEFRDEAVPLIGNVIQTDVPIYSTRTVNLFDDVDWEEFVYNPVITGARVGQAMPPFVVAAFQSAKPSSSQAPARKRFGALSESDVQGNGLQDVSAYFTALTALATKLGEPMITGTGNTYNPVIVKRIKYTTTGGKTAYRLPESLVEAITFPAVNWSWDNIVTSQITRKLGRGI